MPSKNFKVPLPGDGVWHPEWKNGVVLTIDWMEKTTIVEFYNDKFQTEFDISDYYDKWHGGFNQWILEP